MTNLPYFLICTYLFPLTCLSLALLLCVKSTAVRAFCTLEDLDVDWFAELSTSSRAELAIPWT